MHLHIRLALVAASAILIACSEDDAGPAAPAGNGTVSGTVSGNGISASLSAPVGTTGNDLAFTVTSGSNTLTFQIQDAVTSGDFLVGPTRPNLVIYTEGSSRWSTGVNGGRGKIKIWTLTRTQAVGTFDLVLAPEFGTPATGYKYVSDGAFNVKLAN